MSFTKRFFEDLRRPRWDWRQYPHPEAFATAMALAGTETAEALGLLRSALDEAAAEEDAAREAERAREFEARRREGAAAVGQKWLAEIGWRLEDE
jgi:hypothetical protein